MWVLVMGSIQLPVLTSRIPVLLHTSRTLARRAVNQLLCNPVKYAWTARVKSHFKWLFTILVENGGPEQFGR
jgi:hypothetical protein